MYLLDVMDVVRIDGSRLMICFFEVPHLARRSGLDETCKTESRVTMQGSINERGSEEGKYGTESS